MCKLQVGLLGSARGLQKDLEKIAGRADTNTPDGLHYVLQGIALTGSLPVDAQVMFLDGLWMNAPMSIFVAQISPCVMAGQNLI